jgi:hypothetical protein
MLDKEEVQEAIDKFRKYVVQQSRSNLTKQKKNASKRLYDSIKGVSKVNPNSISLYFEMEEHGLYQDKGVKGKTSSTKAPNSPFKFGSGTGRKGGLTEGIQKWVKGKRFQFRDKQGKFMSYNSTAFLITRSIYNKGLKPSIFFTKPFEKAFANLPEELVEAYGIDIVRTFTNLDK